MSLLGREAVRRAFHARNRARLAEAGAQAVLIIDSSGHTMLREHYPSGGMIQRSMGYPQGENLARAIASTGASLVVRFKAYKPEYLARLTLATKDLDRIWP